MQVPLSPLSRLVTIVAGLLGLGLMALAAAGEPDAFLERFGVKLLEAGATVALAVAGISEVATYLRTREWRRRTRYLAFLLLGRAEDELAELEAAAYGVLVGPARELDQHNLLEIGPAFRIPVEVTQARYFEAALRVTGDATKRFDRLHQLAGERVSDLEQAAMADDFAAIHRHLDELSRMVEGEAAVDPPPTAEPPGPAPAPTEVPEPGRPAVVWPAWLDVDELRARADQAVPTLRANWAAFEDTIGQLGGLLDSEPARTLLEASLDLRQAVWMYEPAPPDPDRGATDAAPLLRAARLNAWRVGHARGAVSMVSAVVMAGWIVLSQLAEILEERVGDFPAALERRRFKAQSDQVAELAITMRAEAVERTRDIGELRRLLGELFRERAAAPPRDVAGA